MTDDTGCNCGECDSCHEWRAAETKAYAARKAAHLERIRIASGARELKEYGPKKRRKKRAPGAPLSCGCIPEDDEIKAIVRWDNATGSRFDLWFTRAEANETERLRFGDSKAAQRRRGWLTQHGADNPGFPDLLCRALPGVLVEMKSKCSRHKLGESQKWRIPELRAAGWVVFICHGAEDAITQLETELARRKP